MSDIAPPRAFPMLKTEPGGNIPQPGDVHNNLVEVGHISSVVVGISGSPGGSAGIMMPTIISDESISAPASPIGSGNEFINA